MSDRNNLSNKTKYTPTVDIAPPRPLSMATVTVYVISNILRKDKGHISIDAMIIDVKTQLQNCSLHTQSQMWANVMAENPTCGKGFSGARSSLATVERGSYMASLLRERKNGFGILLTRGNVSELTHPR